MKCPCCQSKMECEQHCEPDAAPFPAMRPHAIYTCEECGYEGIWRRDGYETLYDPRDDVPVPAWVEWS